MLQCRSSMRTPGEEKAKSGKAVGRAAALASRAQLQADGTWISATGFYGTTDCGYIFIRRQAKSKFTEPSKPLGPVLTLQPPSSLPRHPSIPHPPLPPSLSPPSPAATPVLPQAPVPAVRRALQRAVRGPRPLETPCGPIFTTAGPGSRKSRCADRVIRSS